MGKRQNITYGIATKAGFDFNVRELMLPEEVRMLDNRYALLFIRGERPGF